MRLAPLVCAVIAAALAVAAPLRAQERLEKPASAKKPPAQDPRKGPNLQYSRGPKACLSESEFRDEVGIILDGIDHWAADSKDTVRVEFSKIPGGYKGTVVYVDAAGKADPPTVKTYYNCEILARGVAGTASGFIPPKPEERQPPPPPPPPPPPAPDPELPACEVRAPCPDTRPSPWVAWAAPAAVPPGFQNYEVVAPSRSFLERLRKMNLTIALSGMALVGVGVADNVSPGLDIAGEFRGQVFSFAVEFRGLPPQKAYARYPIDPSKHFTTVEADLSEWSGLLVPCARYKWFVGCAVAQGGVIVWKTYSGETDGGTLSFGPRVGFEIPLGDRFGVFGFGEALFRAVIPHVYASVSDVPDLPPANVRWDASPVVGVFSAGLVVKLN